MLPMGPLLICQNWRLQLTAPGKTGVTASLSIDKSTMTLISDDGYDIVVENYQLVGVTGPTMNISGADEDFANLTDGSTQFSDNLNRLLLSYL